MVKSFQPEMAIRMTAARAIRRRMIFLMGNNLSEGGGIIIAEVAACDKAR